MIDKATLRESGGFRQSPEQLARVRELAANPQAANTYREELRNGSRQFHDQPLDASTPDKPANQKPGATGLQNPALGSAEEHYNLPLDPQAIPSGKPQGEPVKPPSGEPQAGGSGNLRPEGKKAEPQADDIQVPNGLYEQWVRAVNAGECLPSLKSAWSWIQKRIAGTQRVKASATNREIRLVAESFFLRAVKDGHAAINPKYTSPKCGFPKYLWNK